MFSNTHPCVTFIRSRSGRRLSAVAAVLSVLPAVGHCAFAYAGGFVNFGVWSNDSATFDASINGVATPNWLSDTNFISGFASAPYGGSASFGPISESFTLTFNNLGGVPAKPNPTIFLYINFGFEVARSANTLYDQAGFLATAQLNNTIFSSDRFGYYSSIQHDGVAVFSDYELGRFTPTDNPGTLKFTITLSGWATSEKIPANAVPGPAAGLTTLTGILVPYARRRRLQSRQAVLNKNHSFGNLY